MCVRVCASEDDDDDDDDECFVHSIVLYVRSINARLIGIKPKAQHIRMDVDICTSDT